MSTVGLRIARIFGLILDGIRYPWGEASPFLVAGFIVLFLAVGIWGAFALISDEVVEGVRSSGYARPGVTVVPALNGVGSP